MIKQWKPVLEDINEEITRLNAVIADTPFNSEFGHQMQRVKIRTAELHERLTATLRQMKADAAAERAVLEYTLGEFHHDYDEAYKKLSACRLLRAEKSRANYLHIQAIKSSQAEEGGEQ